MNSRITRDDCCVLNSGNGSWAFEPLANQLARLLGIEVSDQPRRFNYLLFRESPTLPANCRSFVPLEAIRLASDKRLLATVFNEHRVPTPETMAIEDFAQVQDYIRSQPAKQWCLKYPISCGANGHRRLSLGDSEPANWPRPFVVQEFIPMISPEVYRTYCAGGELFGWVVRRFPEGVKPSPWVAHARGARYANAGAAPRDALDAARSALQTTKLIDSFGCADLLCKTD